MIYPEHVQWIIDNRGEALNKAFSHDYSYKTIDNSFGIFLDADPTSGKKLTQWLVDTYINGGFRWEDIQSGANSKVFDTLCLYIEHKSKLDSTNHIGQYDSLGSVYKDIALFIKPEKSSRSVKRAEQNKAHEESKIFIKSDTLTVVIPKTEYASKWWGRGTQWCTAGDKDNLFNNYYQDGPLIIIIVNGVKTQLHINLFNRNNSVQFMNEQDNRVDLDFIEENWILFSHILKWAVRRNGNILQYIPEHAKTLELCLEAVISNGSSLQYVPEHVMTEELYLRAVKQCGLALYFIPGYLRTAELCREAVIQNGIALRYLPESLKTAELCLMAIRSDGCNLYYVPEDLKTIELCLEAVRQNGNSICFVTEHLRTSELYLEAVRQNGYALRYIYPPIRTVEICLEALKQNGEVLRYVPDVLRTPEMIKIYENNSNVKLSEVFRSRSNSEDAINIIIQEISCAIELNYLGLLNN